MYKAIFYTVLITCVICGAIWFTLGRNNTSNLEAALSRANGDFKIVQRDLKQFKSDFDGYSGGISTTVEKAGRLRGEVGELRDEAGEHVSELGSIRTGLSSINGRIISVENAIREGVILSRDLSDLAYWYRRRSEEDEKED